jgi:hypothetical protein
LLKEFIIQSYEERDAHEFMASFMNYVGEKIPGASQYFKVKLLLETSYTNKHYPDTSVIQEFPGIDLSLSSSFDQAVKEYFEPYLNGNRNVRTSHVIEDASEVVSFNISRFIFHPRTNIYTKPEKNHYPL